MSDTKRVLNCPACDSVMTKIYIPDAGIHVDICADGCGGILFDNRELEKFDDNSENADDILAALSNKTFKQVEGKELRICPICETPMVKVGSGKGEVEIDVCNYCGSKFLDNGELEKIRSSEITKTDNANNVIEYLYQKNFVQAINGHVDIFNKKSNAVKRKQFFDKLILKYILKK